MGDRQDIDALLIGAVYGELDAAEKDRLDAHLASHPADRAAMDSLAATRSRVRADLARMPEADPAPAISTLLLQEAARRAPRQRGGVLAWVAGLFTPIARHPAMAGALALALIGGSAVVLHERGKVSATEQAVSNDGAPTAAPSAPGDVASNLANNLDDKKAATEGYEVKLAEQQRAEPDPADPTARGESGADLADKDTGDASKNVAAVAPHHQVKSAHQGSGSGYLEVTTPERKPKQLDDQTTQGFYAGLAGGAAAASGGGGTTTGTVTATDSAAPPPVPPRTAPTGGSIGGAPGGPAPAAAYDHEQDAKLTEWAQVQHQRLVALVKAGNCTEAGRVGSEIAARAPEYYAAHIENDRAVKSCKQYIDQEKRKKANEQYKSRARNSYEPDLEQPAAQ